MEKVSIGTKLNELRKQKGVSLQALADYLHVSRQTISKWENNTSLPDIEIIMKLCDYYGITMNELLSSDKENTLEDMYSQLQQTLNNLQKSNQKKHYLNIILICISIFSLCVTVAINKDVKNVNNIANNFDPKHNDRTNVNSFMLFNILPTESDMFVDQNGNLSHMRIEKIDLTNETIQLDFQFALKEYTDKTSVTLEFTNSFFDEPLKYELNKIGDNVFAFNETLPLKNYHDVNLIVSDGEGHYKVENLGYNNNCYYLSFVTSNLPLLYVTTDMNRELILDKIIYKPSLEYAFYENLFRGKFDNNFKIKIKIWDQNKNVIFEEKVSFCEKTEFQLEKPLPLDTTMYVSICVSCDYSDGWWQDWICGYEDWGEPFKIIDENKRAIIYSAARRQS